MQQSSFEFTDTLIDLDDAASGIRASKAKSSKSGSACAEPGAKALALRPVGSERSIRQNTRARKSRTANLPRRSPGNNSEMHLAAARRLSREIRRTNYHSPEATRTGRLVCRHLVAMLQQNGLQQNQAGAKQNA